MKSTKMMMKRKKDDDGDDKKDDYDKRDEGNYDEVRREPLPWDLKRRQKMRLTKPNQK